MGMNNATPKKNTVSQSTKKVLKVLEDFMYSPLFITEILKLRKKYNIPEKGFSHGYSYDENISLTEEPFLFLPAEIKKDSKISKKNLAKNIRSDINDLLKDTIEPVTVFTASVIAYYLFFNEISFDFNEKIINFYNKYGLQEVIDFDWAEEAQGSPKELFKEKPVAILLHPETTQRDLLDFIKKNFNKDIKPLLEGHKTKGLYKNIKLKEKDKLKKVKKLIAQNPNSTANQIHKKRNIDDNDEYKLDIQNIHRIKNNTNKKFKKKV